MLYGQDFASVARCLLPQNHLRVCPDEMAILIILVKSKNESTNCVIFVTETLIFLFKVICCYDFFPIKQHILGIFIQADGQIGTCDVVQVIEAAVLQGHDGIVAALAGPAVEIDRPVFGYFFHTLPQLA